ncbi:MAG: DUF4364 family protein, partial [Clostridia bacterium]|nr:DUF4364 family protein [Clostridia bacterium]
MDTKISKLILLFVLEKMDIPATSETLNDMCCSQNNWLSYMTLIQIIPELIDKRFISCTENSGINYFKITNDGHNCLGCFCSEIPSSIRNDISSYIRKNRQNYKRNQEYFRDYKKNKDGTYTLLLKITDPTVSKLELKLNVDNHDEAMSVFKKWNTKASDVYASIY